MTDLHEYVDGIEPLARIDSVPGGKIWQTKAKAYVAAAPTPGGSHLLVLQSGRFDPTPVASWVLQHALANWDSLLAEDAPLRVAPGLPPLGDWPFDVVVAFPPDLHNFEKRKHPDVHERAFQVFPACRYEVPTALSEREAVSLKSPKVVRFTDVERVPVPIVRVRYELASQRSVGKDRALSKLTTMRTMVEQLAESPNGFVEIENHRAEVVRIEWSGEYQVVVGDERARVERAEIWPWLQRFARTGSGAGGSGEPGGVRSPAEFSLSPELSLRLEDGSTMDSLADWQLRQELERLDAKQNRFAVLSRSKQEYIQCYANDDGTFDVEVRAGGAKDHHVSTAPVNTETMIEAFLRYGAGEDWRSLMSWEGADLPA